MEIQPQTTQPISDDQELAKVLAGVSQQADEAAAQDDNLAADLSAVADAVVAPQEPLAPVMPPVLPAFQMDDAPSGDLQDIKKVAISELKPLVEKLNLPADEKFDLYLLLIRSTDDVALIAPAHEAAKSISDDARRAQALLDIIKEIDYLSGASKEPVNQ